MNKDTQTPKPGAKRILSLVMNLLIFILVCWCLAAFFTRGGEGNMQVFGKYCFMFFTVDSNILAAVAALLLAALQLRDMISGGRNIPLWAMALKYVGTVAVSVTFFTVVCFLGPVFGFWGMFAGNNFFLHLICPLLAIFSCFLLEAEPPLRFRSTLLGLLPTFVYGVVYIVMVVFRRAWYDFYGFNMGGFWYLSAALMLIATYLLALGLWALRRAVGKRKREEAPAA